MNPVERTVARHLWHRGLDPFGKLCLGTHEIDSSHEVEACHDVGQHRSYLVGNSSEDADDLLSFLAFKFSYPVVGIYHLSGLDIERLSGCRLVMHNASYLSLVRRKDRNHESSVAHGRCHVFIDNAIALCRTQDVVEQTRDAAYRACKLPADIGKSRRCVVLDFSSRSQGAVDLAAQVGEDHNISSDGFHQRKRLASFLLFWVEELHKVDDGTKRTAQAEQVFCFKEGAVQTQALQLFGKVEEPVGRHRSLAFLQYLDHLFDQCKLILYVVAFGHELHLINACRAQRT